MREGGKKLARVKEALKLACVPGKSFEDLEALAQAKIKEEGAVPSFSTVHGYHHATHRSGHCYAIGRRLVRPWTLVLEIASEAIMETPPDPGRNPRCGAPSL